MTFSVGKVLGIGAGYNAGATRRIEGIQPQKFIQQSVSSGKAYNLNYPAQANSTPYGESPRAKHLDILS